MKMKKVISGMCAALLLFSSCVGCNTTGKTNNAESQSSAAAQKTNLEYFQIKTETVDTVNGIIKQFEAKNPGVTIQQNPQSSGLTLWPTRIASNDPPAIFNEYTHNASFIQACKNGLVKDLTGDPLLENVDPSIVKIGLVDGKSYIVPIALATWGVIYNADLFKKYNISVPQTYDELMAVCKKLKAAGVTPFEIADKDPTFCHQTATPEFGLYVNDIENLFDKVIDGKDKLSTNADVKKLAQRLYDQHVTYAEKGAEGVDVTTAINDFANGKAAMLFDGTWGIQAIMKANSNFNYGIFPLPADDASNTKITIQIDTGLGFPSKDTHYTEAKQFVSFMSSEEQAQKYCDATSYLPAIKGVKNHVTKLNTFETLIQQGKIYPVLARKFPQASNTMDFGKALQNYYLTGNSDQFLKQLDTIFFNGKNS